VFTFPKNVSIKLLAAVLFDTRVVLQYSALQHEHGTVVIYAVRSSTIIQYYYWYHKSFVLKKEKKNWMGLRFRGVLYSKFYDGSSYCTVLLWFTAHSKTFLVPNLPHMIPSVRSKLVVSEA
jgi:hypothetical protein